MTDFLASLVACDALREGYPRGVPMRGCLRRQFEAKRLGKDWAPAHAICIGCQLGARNQAAARRAGVQLATCEKGHAIVGSAECETCAEERSLHEVRRREAPRPPPQDLIWRAGAPDVPIGGPPATSEYSGYRPATPPTPGGVTNPELAARAARKKREAAASSFEGGKKEGAAGSRQGPFADRPVDPATSGGPQPTAPAGRRQETSVEEVSPHAPSPGKPGTSPARTAPAHAAPAPTPTKETTMPCPECKNPSRHRANCSKNPERKSTTSAPAPKAASPAKPAAPVAPPPAKVTTLPTRTRSAPVAGGGVELDELPFDALIAQRDALDAAIDRRIARAEAEVAALKAAQAKTRTRVEAAG